ncbi:MAG TPA: hypothetical protein ENJ32_09855 [Crenotrichaceae bacterium]|nr:hypothetical protein [Crenotrichaceae bacterium]
MSLIDTKEEKLEAAKQEAKRIQKKYTWIMALMFFIEIMPLPFTAFISLYTVRKRPDWFPYSVKSLYADIPKDDNDTPVTVNPAATRKKCTMTIISMMIVDLGPVPLTIPVGLYIVRRRPKWFRNVVERLYADKPIGVSAVASKRVRLYDD